MALLDTLILSIRRSLAAAGVSVHRLRSIQGLMAENRRMSAEIAALKSDLAAAGSRAIYGMTTEDYDAAEKTQRILDGIPDFGRSDFADLATWLLASSLSNHRVVHQRLDEASLLWRAVGMSAGPILEIGRAAGGSTLILLGASGDRRVISIDRAPSHAWMAQHVFDRPDVAPRLKLYRRSSREPIAEDAFGLMFVDGDHSFEGVCHDIATYWNRLRPFGDRPALAVFHDGADNPITFVEPVKHACDALIAEGVARKVESWGSMLVLEKIAPIDPARWYAKQHREFWRGLEPGEPDFEPNVLTGSLADGAPPPGHADDDLLGAANVDEAPWIAEGVTIGKLPLNADNPLRLVAISAGAGAHAVHRSFVPDAARWTVTAFVRQCRHGRFRLFAIDGRGAALAHADFELTRDARILGGGAAPGATILGAHFEFRCGFFACSLSIDAPSSVERASVGISIENGSATPAPGSGFYFNLASVRRIA